MSDPAKEAKQLRVVAIVIALTMLIWLAIQALGRTYDWAAQWAFLADLSAIGAFVWSLIVTWRIWRRKAV